MPPGWSETKSKALDLGTQNEVYTGLSSYIKEGKAFPAFYGRIVSNPDDKAAPTYEDNALIGLVNPNRLWGVGSTLMLFNRLTFDALVEHQGGFYVQNYTAYQSARRGACFGIRAPNISPAIPASSVELRAACYG